MKRILLIILPFLLLSCEKEETGIVNEQESNELSHDIVTNATLEGVWKSNFISGNDGKEIWWFPIENGVRIPITFKFGYDVCTISHIIKQNGTEKYFQHKYSYENNQIKFDDGSIIEIISYNRKKKKMALKYINHVYEVFKNEEKIIDILDGEPIEGSWKIGKVRHFDSEFYFAIIDASFSFNKGNCLLPAYFSLEDGLPHYDFSSSYQRNGNYLTFEDKSIFEILSFDKSSKSAKFQYQQFVYEAIKE